jgi:dTDP-4-dehydrorhamnose reductase
MKFLLYGNGWIGKMFSELILADLNNILVIGTKRCDIYDDIYNEVIREMPDRVICMIGRTGGPGCNTIDYLEDKPYMNVRDNLYGPLVLAEVCKNVNIHLSYMGTGCIYNTEDDTLVKFTEESEPNFTGSKYSYIKGITDKLIREFQGCLNMRIRMPILNLSALDDKNLLTKLHKYKYLTTEQNSMTYLPEMIPIMLDLIIKGETGTFNFVNDGSISPFDLMKKIYNNTNIYHIGMNQFELYNNGHVKARRSNNVMSCEKLKQKYQVSNINDLTFN